MSFGTQKGNAFDIVGTSAAQAAVSATAATLGAFKVPNFARRMSIAIAYNANATPGGILELVPMIADGQPDTTAPAPTEDIWTIPGVWDGTVTAGAGVAVASGIDWTTTPSFGQVTHLQLALRTPVTTVASDKVRIRWSINVEDATFVAFQIKEVSANTGTAWIRGRFYA